jgi:membrane-bound lytic murein transglycosylase B
MFHTKKRIRLSVIAAAAVLAASLFGQPALADAGFQKWVAGFRSVAAQSGISGKTYDRAFRGVTAPDPEVLEKARYQPEFSAPVWDYFDNRVHEDSIAVGRQMARQWKPWLDRIESQYGVDRHILLAIWSMESNYGEILKNDKVMRNVVRSLATLAYGDKKRAKFARQQLIAALEILQRGDIDESHLTSSSRRATRPMRWTWTATGGAISGAPCPMRWRPPRTCCARMAGRPARPGATRWRCPRAASSRPVPCRCRNGSRSASRAPAKSRSPPHPTPPN